MRNLSVINLEPLFRTYHFDFQVRYDKVRTSVSLALQVLLQMQFFTVFQVYFIILRQDMCFLKSCDTGPKA